jgi:hypothetical protein
MPPADLGDGAVRSGASVDATVPHRVDALLDLPGALWQPVARLLFASVHATGHRVWLSGGVVRDVVSGVKERRINDLDLSGTVPAGRFTDILYQSLRASRMSEFRTTVTPGSLVCAVTPPGTDNRLIEYRGLAATGFQFPAVGSSLSEDVRQRDFTFNALFYDILDHKLFDPSGSGVADLIADERKFVPLAETDDPCAQAEIVIRAMKFALRWAEAPKPNLKGLNSWLNRLDPDMCRGFTASQWRRLSHAYQSVVKAAKAEQLAFAARLEQPGRELLETLIGAVK